MKVNKGDRGYFDAKKKKTFLFFVFFVLIGVAMVATGYVATHTKKNLLTVAGILFVLPAAKYLTILITMLPYKALEETVYQKFHSILPVKGREYCDLVFTSPQKIMHLDYLFVTENELVAFDGGDGKQDELIHDYFVDSLKKRGVNAHFHVFHDAEAMANRLLSLTREEEIPTEITEFLSMIIV